MECSVYTISSEKLSFVNIYFYKSLSLRKFDIVIKDIEKSKFRF